MNTLEKEGKIVLSFFLKYSIFFSENACRYLILYYICKPKWEKR
jgi:hypothetical protein